MAHQDIIDFLTERFSQLTDLERQWCTHHVNQEYYDSWCESPFFKDKESVWNNICKRVGAAYYANGATKLVMFFDEFPDVVIKIPFYGYIYYDRDWNIYEDKTEIFNGAEWVRDSRTWDYCATEAVLYREANDVNLANYFASTEFLFQYKDIYFYISDRVTPYYNIDHFPDISDESMSKASEFSAPFFETQLSILFEQNSDEDVQELLDFIEEWEIKDLHTGNWGWDKNNMLKILDYSSYHS